MFLDDPVPDLLYVVPFVAARTTLLDAVVDCGIVDSVDIDEPPASGLVCSFCLHQVEAFQDTKDFLGALVPLGLVPCGIGDEELAGHHTLQVQVCIEAVADPLLQKVRHRSPNDHVEVE